MIQSTIMGKGIHTSEICSVPNPHCLALTFFSSHFLCNVFLWHVCMTSSALFLVMWCGMSGMSHCVSQQWGGHCLQLRTHEGASTIDTGHPPLFSPPNIPKSLILSSECLCFVGGKCWGWDCLQKKCLQKFCFEGSGDVKSSLWQLIACMLLLIGLTKCFCVAAL